MPTTWTYSITRVDASVVPTGTACFGPTAASSAQTRSELDHAERLAAATTPEARNDVERTRKPPHPIVHQHCNRSLAVTHRIRALDPSTGEIREQWACTNHASWIAACYHAAAPSTVDAG